MERETEVEDDNKVDAVASPSIDDFIVGKIKKDLTNPKTVERQQQALCPS